MACKSLGATGHTLNLIKHLNAPNDNLLGILERPNLPLSVDELKYKVHIAGQPGVGKSTLAAWLAGLDITTQQGSTLGTQMMSIYCPCESNSTPKKTLLFHLDVWDIGVKSRRQGSDLLQDCPENADAVLILFSCNDLETFKNLPRIFAEFQSNKENKPFFLAGATGWGMEEAVSVSHQDIVRFEMTWKIPVVRIPIISSADTYPDHRRAVLRLICEGLWHRDQLLIEQDGT